MKQGRPTRAAFAFIFVTVALDMLALGVIVPILPKLILQFHGGDVARSAKYVGTFGLIWAAMQFLFAPVLGALSDRFGRRPIVLLSNFGLGLDYLLMAVAQSLPLLFVGRAISGITAASFSTAGAYIADVTPAEERASKFGMLGAAFGLGFVIGPALGGWLGAIDLRLPFWVAGVLSLLNGAYGFFILPESLPPEKRVAFKWRSANVFGSIELLGSHPMLIALAVSATASYLAHESLPSVFVLYTDYRYHWSPRMVGTVLATVGVCSTIVSAVLVRRAIALLGESGALRFGYLCGAIGFGLYGIAPSTMIFFLGIPFGALWGLSGPALQAVMTRHVDAGAQGKLQGALGSIRGVTGMLGPIVFTQTFALAIGPLRAWQVPGAPYLLASGLLFIALGLAWRSTRS